MTSSHQAMLSRRSLLKLGTAAALPALAQTSKLDKPPYKVLWNDDTTNIPKWTPGEVFQDDQLRGAINSVADKGIDAYVLSPGLGWIPWWKSRVVPDHYQWRLAKSGKQPDCFGKYLLAGGDLIATLIEHCRTRKLAALASFRLNDCHRQEEKESVWVSRFYEEHPEYLLNPQHYAIQGYSSQRGQNWAIPEVRAYKLALVRELCENYDLDGTELDFLRDDYLFRLDETTEAERIAWVTDFVRSVRQALDNGPVKGRRRYLGVRIPLQLAAHGRIGLDVVRLAEAGVDMFNLSDWYHTNQRTDLAQVRALVPRSAVYLELHYVTAHKLASGYSTASFPRTSNEQFYTTAHLAYSRGADGVSFFNMQYNKRSYQVLPRISNRTWLAEQPQYYYLGKSRYLSQLPVTLVSQQTKTLQMDMAPPASFPQKKIRLRLHADRPLRHEGLKVAINGQMLEPSDDISSFFDNPYDAMISDSSNRLAFTAAEIELRNGLNELSVTLTSGEALQLTFVDVMVVK
jgi:hypothetical protein